MPNAFGIAHIKEGASSLAVSKAANSISSPGDLNDRIINLRFKRAKKGSYFTLRSDYEAVHYANGSSIVTGFKRCTQKPTIKVSYKQVSNSVAIEVGIEVTNLVIPDEDAGGADNMFSITRTEGNEVIGNPIIECEIQMGYRSQFPDWTSVQHRQDVEGFYAMTGGHFYGRKITVQILAVYQKSLPPDRVTFFHGIIGTMDGGLRYTPGWAGTEEDLLDYRHKSSGFPQFGEPGTDMDGELESVLYQFVTRRFVRPSVAHHTITQEGHTNTAAMSGKTERVYRQAVYLDKYKSYEKDPDPGNEAIKRFQYARRKVDAEGAEEDTRQIETLTDGILPVAWANKIGVVCILSKTLGSMKTKALYGYKKIDGLSEEEAAKALEAVWKRIPQQPFNEQINTLGGQLDAIQRHYPFIRWYQLTTGDFYFYHERDSEADLWIDPFIVQMQKDGIVPIPAIYDMTPSGTRTIRCPFYSFLDPMTTIVFQNRFMLGTFTSYFYPVRTNAFLVITASIEFCTTGDENQMELMCVDMEGRKVLADSRSGRLYISEPEGKLEKAAEQAQEELPQWEERKVPVSAGQGWKDIIRIYMDAPPQWWPDGQPTLEQKLADIKSWNEEFFEENGEQMQRSYQEGGDSYENSDGGVGTLVDGVKVPKLRAGDKIKIRDPYMPSAEYARRKGRISWQG